MFYEEAKYRNNYDLSYENEGKNMDKIIITITIMYQTFYRKDKGVIFNLKYIKNEGTIISLLVCHVIHSFLYMNFFTSFCIWLIKVYKKKISRGKPNIGTYS